MTLFLSNECCQPFRYCGYHRHNHRHQKCFKTNEKTPYIHHHTNTDKKKWNKNGIADKLYTVHQRRNIWNKTVQNKSGEKCSQNTFYAQHLSQQRSRKHQRQNKNVLKNAIAVARKKETGYFGKQEKQHEYKNTIRYAQPNPKRRIYLAGFQCYYDSQNKQCQGYGNDGARNRDAY